MNLQILHKRIEAVAPIWGVNADGVIDFQPEATQAQRDAAAAVVAAYDPTVPATVSPYQARVALLNAGLLASVEALMIDPATPQSAKIAWEYATQWDRSSDFIATLGPALGLTSSQVDDLFRSAASVT